MSHSHPANTGHMKLMFTPSRPKCHPDDGFTSITMEEEDGILLLAMEALSQYDNTRLGGEVTSRPGWSSNTFTHIYSHTQTLLN